MKAGDEPSASVNQEVTAVTAYAAGKNIYLGGSDWRALGVLSPHEEARELAAMEHAEAARSLSRSEVAAAVKVVRALLLTDRGLAISLLGSVIRDRAEELIVAVGSAAAGLEKLPTAAEEIAISAAKASKLLGKDTGRLARAAKSKRGTEGYYRPYADGIVHWSARGGAHATTGAAAAYYVSQHGGTRGRLGFPVSPVKGAAKSQPFGTDGTWQLFEWTSDYGRVICDRLGTECGATLYWSDKYGPCRTWGDIGEYYESFGGTRGRLGFPVTDAYEVTGPTRTPSGKRTTGLRQKFEGGTVYYSDKTGAIEVSPAIADYHNSRGDMGGALGFPVSPELDAAPFQGTSGKLQRFEFVRDYPRKSILDHWSDEEGPGGATIYSSAHGVHSVAGGIGEYYEKSGGTSWLGFPTSEEKDARTSNDQPWRCFQDFEVGTIFWDDGKQYAAAVSRDMLAAFSADTSLRQRLGFPVTAASSLDQEAEVHVQFFEHGVVTIRSGSAEAWVTPE